jgi:ceramide glucosyltransferase
MLTHSPTRLFLAVLSFLSFGVTCWRWVAAARFPLHRRASLPESLPGCTILKPLRGCDSETRSCLRSWLTQDYPGPVQILFGVAGPDDPACPLVRELLAEFPRADAHLIICPETLSVSGKISKLRQLEPLILHPLVAVSDADVMVPPDFLANAASTLADPTVGLVNCFYRLANPSTLAMRWEAIAINADFWGSVLQSQTMRKVDFALGAAMALRAGQLREIGGFAALADYLADDYHLGQQIFRSGKRIVFSPVVVECHEAPMGWPQVWAHQLRWARTIRFCQPVLFFFSIVDNASLWPLLWLAASLPAVPIWVGIVCAFLLGFRVVSALDQERRLSRSLAHFRYFWLVPAKDLLNVAVWAMAFTGNHVLWRGVRYYVRAGGHLEMDAAFAGATLARNGSAGVSPASSGGVPPP